MGQTEISPEVVRERVNFLNDANITVEKHYVKLTSMTARQNTDQWSAVNSGAVYAWDLANAVQEHALAMDTIRAEITRLAHELGETVATTLAADDSARTTFDSLISRLEHEATHRRTVPLSISPDGDPTIAHRVLVETAQETDIGDRPPEDDITQAASSSGSATTPTAQQ